MMQKMEPGEGMRKQKHCGKVPMKVNTMPGIIVNEVKDERGEMSGDVNSLQSKDSCLF